MVARGLFFLTNILRGTVKDPPPCVDTTPVPTGKGKTQRAIAEMRIADNNCGSCHRKFEPLAFGLEKFDGLGSFHHQDEHGNRLREDRAILMPREAKATPYETASEMMDLLARSPRVAEALTWKVAQISLGRPLGRSEAPAVAAVHAASQLSGGTYADVLLALATSELVLNFTPATHKQAHYQPSHHP